MAFKLDIDNMQNYHRKLLAFISATRKLRCRIQELGVIGALHDQDISFDKMVKITFHNNPDPGRDAVLIKECQTLLDRINLRKHQVSDLWSDEISLYESGVRQYVAKKTFIDNLLSEATVAGNLLTPMGRQIAARNKIATNCKHTRLQRGHGQNAAAKAVGCSVATLQKIEYATITPSMTQLVKLATFYKVSPNSLLAGVHPDEVEKIKQGR